MSKEKCLRKQKLQVMLTERMRSCYPLVSVKLGYVESTDLGGHFKRLSSFGTLDAWIRISKCASRLKRSKIQSHVILCFVFTVVRLLLSAIASGVVCQKLLHDKDSRTEI